MWTDKDTRAFLTMILFVSVFVATLILVHAQWPNLREGEAIAVGIAMATTMSLFYTKGWEDGSMG